MDALNPDPRDNVIHKNLHSEFPMICGRIIQIKFVR